MTALRQAGGAATVFVIAGEESGDALGAALMASLRERMGAVRFVGVGGPRMAAFGLTSLFPMNELALHGITEALANVRRIFRRIRETAEAVVAADPDVLVIIDVPAFNLRVAKRVRRMKPGIPIVEYVSPTVWAYWPGRAKRMAPHVDRLLAVLPFEPEEHRKLGGPPTTYVGHPLLTQVGSLRPGPGERKALGEGRPVLLVLPGSRRSEVDRLLDRFGETVALVSERAGPLEVILPAVDRLADLIRERVASWPVQPDIVLGRDAARAAFRRAHAALAASGTVTLELALSGVPMVVAYRVDPVLRNFTWMLRSASFVLPNLIAGRNAVPEFLDGQTRPENLANALMPLLSDTPERAAQLAAFAEVERNMAVAGEPAGLAADIVVATMRKRA